MPVNAITYLCQLFPSACLITCGNDLSVVYIYKLCSALHIRIHRFMHGIYNAFLLLHVYLHSAVRDWNWHSRWWATFCGGTLGPFTYVDVTLTCTVDLNIFTVQEHHLMESVFPNGTGHLQQDGAPCHTAKIGSGMVWGTQKGVCTVYALYI